MASKAAILAATFAFTLAFVGCSDSVVGTDDEASTPLFQKGGVKPPPGGEDPTDFRPITVTLADDSGDKIRSDGRDEGKYVDGDCGVWANIGNFADARFDPDRDYKRKMARDPECGAARALVFEFPDWRGTKTVGAFMNVDSLDAMPIGDPPVPMETTALFHVCNTLEFPQVLAERTTETTWTVTTDGASDEAICADGSVYHMPFTLYITE